MKNFVTLTLTSILTATLFTGCGSQDFGSLPFAPNYAPLMAQSVTQRASTANTVVKTSFSPDQNGMQFGFDFITIEFRSATNSLDRMDIHHSLKSGMMMGSIVRQLDGPNPQQEYFHSDKPEQAKQWMTLLQGLKAGNSQDTQIVSMTIARLKKIAAGQQVTGPVALQPSPLGQAQAKTVRS